MKHITLLILCFPSFLLMAQDGHKFLLKGDQSYQDNDFEKAELNYRKALEEGNSTKGTYNLGNSTYRQERFDEAISHFEVAAESTNNETIKAQAFHNLGNAHFQAGKYKESVEAFKNALRIDPNDLNTKKNLLRAIRKLPPPQQQQQQQQGENQNNEEQQQQNENQQQQNQDNQEQNENQQQQDQNQNQSSKQKQQQSQDLSKQEAEKLLEIMDQEEQKVQEKLRKSGIKKKQKKDW